MILPHAALSRPHLNHGVEKVECLEGNVALLNLRVFPPVEMGGDTFAATMQVVANMDALIIWQGVGVQPDVRIAADEALQAALDHLRSRSIEE